MVSRISLRRTGFIVFGSRLASIFTGMLFLIMVTHSVTPKAFGLWEFIYDLVTFASYPASVIAFWALRKVARGGQVARTALVVSAILSVAGALAFILASFMLHGNIHSDLSHFLIATIMVPLSYWSTSSISIAYGHKPTITGYSLIFSEVCKVLAAYVLLIVCSAGVDGVIVAVEVSFLVQAASATYMCRSIIGGKVDFAESRKWFVGSWVPLANTLSLLVLSSDTFLAPLVFSGTTVVGYYQAAFSVASLVGYSSYLAIALYPLLLSGRRGGVTNLALDFSLLFGLPMVAGAVALARPILFLLRPAYVSAEAGLSILSVAAFFLSLSFVLDSTLLGLESADSKDGAAASHFRGTAFVFVPAVNLAYAVGYICSMYLVFILTASMPIAQIVELWATVQLAATLVMVIVKARKVRQIKALALPPSLGRYLIAAAVLGTISLALESLILDYGVGTVAFGARLVAIVLLSGGSYFVVVYAIDRSFRTLVRQVASALGGRNGSTEEAPSPEGHSGPEGQVEALLCNGSGVGGDG